MELPANWKEGRAAGAAAAGKAPIGFYWFELPPELKGLLIWLGAVAEFVIPVLVDPLGFANGFWYEAAVFMGPEDAAGLRNGLLLVVAEPDFFRKGLLDTADYGMGY